MKLKRELASVLQDEAETLRAAIADAAPVGATQHLKESVRVTRAGGTLELAVEAGGPLTTKEVRSGSGKSYDYALGNEFGNEHMPAHPFFFSTFFARRAGIQQRIADKVADILDRA